MAFSFLHYQCWRSCWGLAEQERRSPCKSRGLQNLERDRGRAGALGGRSRAQQLLFPQVLGFLFFAAAYLLYKSLSASPHGLEASLPSQSSASDSPADLQSTHSDLQLQSHV